MGRRYRLWVCHRTVNSAGNLPAGVQLRWQAVAERSRKSVARNARSRRRRGLLCGPGVRGTTSFGVLFVTTVSDRPPAREGEIRFFGSERYQRSRSPRLERGQRIYGSPAGGRSLYITSQVVSYAPPARGRRAAASVVLVPGELVSASRWKLARSPTRLHSSSLDHKRAHNGKFSAAWSDRLKRPHAYVSLIESGLGSGFGLRFATVIMSYLSLCSLTGSGSARLVRQQQLVCAHGWRWYVQGTDTITLFSVRGVGRAVG